MKFKKFILASVLLVAASAAWAVESPLLMVRTTSTNVIRELKQNKANLKNNPQLAYSIVERYLLPNIDVRGMSRSVLGRKIWYQASQEQRKRFSKEFTNLVVRTYSGALAEYTDEIVKFQPIREDFQTKQRVKVYSTIVRHDGPNIPLSYRLINKKGQWKVYDMSVEGVSLLQSFRAQFKQELGQGNLEQLTTKLASRNAARMTR